MTDLIRYTILSEVLHCYEHFKTKHISGFGENSLFEKESLGWFVCIKGSREWLYLGSEKPDLKADDKVRITIEKVTA